jgi:hypothetical protein
VTLDQNLANFVSNAIDIVYDMLGPGSTTSNTRPSSTMPNGPRATVNTQTKLLDTIQGRILCVADIRGNISHLNTLAAEANAKAIIHTGDFGFIGKRCPLLLYPSGHAYTGFV